MLVAGGGKVALRKVKGLLEAGARVTVVAPRVEPELEAMPITLLRRKVRPADLAGAYLAFTATDDRSANHRIAQAAKRRGIPVNVADAAGECDFLVPSRIVKGDLQIAVSTGGRSPRRAIEVRNRIERML